MSIFEELDNLVKLAAGVKAVNESESSALDDFPIDPNMETAEQARLYVRKYFADLFDNEDGGGTPPEDDIPEPPKKISGPKPPPPPFKKKDGEEAGEEKKDWEEDEVVWDEEDAMREMEMDEDELDDEDELEDDMKDDEDEYDDFMDKSDSGTGGGSSGDGEGDDDDDDYDDDSSGESGSGDDYDDDDDYEDGEGGDDSGDGGDGDDGDGDEADADTSDGGDDADDSKGGKGGGSGSGKGTGGGKGESGSKPSGDDSKKGGDTDPGSTPTGSDALKSSIEDALDRLRERADADKEKLRKLSDMAKEGTSEDEINDVENELDAEKEGKSAKDTTDLVGKLESTPSSEDLKKEIDDAKISDEQKETLMDNAEKATTAPPTVMDDEEMKKLRSEAVKELEKKCEGHSSLSTEILYHSLKDAKITNEDWKEILKQILKDKSIHSGSEDSKIKKVKWGNKNHLWRSSVLPTKVDRKGGKDTQSIYCFVDYSGSVRSRSNLIISFLGRVMELCMNLKYTDMVVYTFADELSLPKRLTKKMIDEDGYEKVLAQTIAFFEDPSNDVGGSIEDFSLVANEINKIKVKDKDAVAFIFGDGVWTFYGNHQPPYRLREICPKWLKDICAFVFYDTIDEGLEREISYLKEVAGVPNVITTKMKDIKPTFDD